MANDIGEKKITEMAVDIKYITTALQEMRAELKVLTSNMITRDEVESKISHLQDEVDGRIKGANERITTKVDKEDFKKLESKFDEHIKEGSVKWGSVIQSVISSLVVAIVLGALAYYNIK